MILFEFASFCFVLDMSDKTVESTRTHPGYQHSVVVSVFTEWVDVRFANHVPDHFGLIPQLDCLEA